MTSSFSTTLMLGRKYETWIVAMGRVGRARPYMVKAVDRGRGEGLTMLGWLVVGEQVLKNLILRFLKNLLSETLTLCSGSDKENRSPTRKA